MCRRRTIAERQLPRLRARCSSGRHEQVAVTHKSQHAAVGTELRIQQWRGASSCRHSALHGSAQRVHEQTRRVRHQHDVAALRPGVARDAEAALARALAPQLLLQRHLGLAHLARQQRRQAVRGGVEAVQLARQRAVRAPQARDQLAVGAEGKRHGLRIAGKRLLHHILHTQLCLRDFLAVRRSASSLLQAHKGTREAIRLKAQLCLHTALWQRAAHTARSVRAARSEAVDALGRGSGVVDRRALEPAERVRYFAVRHVRKYCHASNALTHIGRARLTSAPPTSPRAAPRQ